jgi:hypothetical protein
MLTDARKKETITMLHGTQKQTTIVHGHSQEGGSFQDSNLYFPSS